MTSYVDIETGQWVLAFDQPYGPYDETMQDHLEGFSKRGGGWESHRANEILHVYEVTDVKPQTYAVGEIVTHPRPYMTKRQHRALVIAAGSTKGEMVALRDKLFAIGAETSDRIEAEMYRRIRKFEERERAKAVKKVHRCLPHIFGGSA